MTFASQPDPHEAGEHRHKFTLARGPLAVHRQRAICGAAATVGQEPAGEHVRRHTGDGELGGSTAQVPIRVTVLEPPHEHGVKTGPGDDAQLAGLGDGTSQAPPGNADPHATLDDLGQGRRVGRERRAFDVGDLRGGERARRDGIAGRRGSAPEADSVNQIHTPLHQDYSQSRFPAQDLRSARKRLTQLAHGAATGQGLGRPTAGDADHEPMRR